MFDVAHAIDGVVNVADWSKVVLEAVNVAGHVANVVERVDVVVDHTILASVYVIVFPDYLDVCSVVVAVLLRTDARTAVVSAPAAVLTAALAAVPAASAAVVAALAAVLAAALLYWLLWLLHCVGLTSRVLKLVKVSCR